MLQQGPRVRELKANFGVQDGRREHYVYEKSFTNRTKAFFVFERRKTFKECGLEA